MNEINETRRLGTSAPSHRPVIDSIQKVFTLSLSLSHSFTHSLTHSLTNTNVILAPLICPSSPSDLEPQQRPPPLRCLQTRIRNRFPESLNSLSLNLSISFSLTDCLSFLSLALSISLSLPLTLIFFPQTTEEYYTKVLLSFSALSPVAFMAEVRFCNRRRRLWMS